MTDTLGTFAQKHRVKKSNYQEEHEGADYAKRTSERDQYPLGTRTEDHVHIRDCQCEVRADGDSVADGDWSEVFILDIGSYNEATLGKEAQRLNISTETVFENVRQPTA